jgi:uncharacterized membrane protein HdeD (DUF308 family)
MSILLGILILSMPMITLLVLVLLFAAWALVIGFTRISMAIQLRKEIKGEGWLVLSGVSSIILGVALILLPGIGSLALILMIGSFSLVSGALLIGAGWRLRKLSSRRKEVPVVA